MTEYAELEKRRERYDAARLKKSDKMQTTHQQLCEQAALLDGKSNFFLLFFFIWVIMKSKFFLGLLNATAEHQMMMAKSIDVYVRAECQYMKEIRAVLSAVKPPDYRKRWSP